MSEHLKRVIPRWSVNVGAWGPWCMLTQSWVLGAHGQQQWFETYSDAAEVAVDLNEGGRINA